MMFLSVLLILGPSWRPELWLPGQVRWWQHAKHESWKKIGTQIGVVLPLNKAYIVPPWCSSTPCQCALCRLWCETAAQRSSSPRCFYLPASQSELQSLSREKNTTTQAYLWHFYSNHPVCVNIQWSVLLFCHTYPASVGPPASGCVSSGQICWG